MNSVHSDTERKIYTVISDPIIPFAQVKEACVTVKADPGGNIENFIDDKMCLGLYDKDN